MNLHLWLGFAIASLVMGLIPGPGVMSIVGYAVGSGHRTALASVAGMAAGNIVAMSLSLAGVGALLAASALAFSILKWAGALYLIGLGMLTIIRKRPVGIKDDTGSVPISPRTAFLSNVALGTFHPKTILFFVAFAPQFISATGNYAQQAAILIATFGLVVGCTDTTYALIATRASHLLRRPGAALWSKRAGGGVLIAAGIATAAARK
jgi:threonine/homoserine/homoserine lactone efflux protein